MSYGFKMSLLTYQALGMSHCDVTFDCPIAKCAIRRKGGGRWATRDARVSAVGSFYGAQKFVQTKFKKKIISLYLKFVFCNCSCTYSASVSAGKVLTLYTLMSVNTAS
jgi:hypothetical protein